MALVILVLLAATGAGIYYLRRRLLAWLLELPPVKYSVGVERAIPVEMADGVRLLTDHYWPKAEGKFPTILIRTPYGRGREVFLFGGYPLGELPAQRFAERGYHVIVQGVRGCYDSVGEFEPHVNEAADGETTVEWISRQPWFDGRLAAWGPSYLGYALWATASKAPTHLKAIVPVITSAENFTVSHPDGAFGLETRLRWSQGMARAKQVHSQSFIRKLRQRFFGKDEDALQSAFMHLPMREADVAAVGQPVPFYREQIDNDAPDSPYWSARDHRAAAGRVEAATHLVGGWYDYYLRGLLRDYAALKDAGRNPYLTIGPWHHASAEGLMAGLREGVRWFEVQLQGKEDELRDEPVRLYVMGADEWREMPAYPPPSRPLAYYLHNNGVLSTDKVGPDSPAAHYTYDPGDPTPALGGALLALKGAGPVDNQPLESRMDVLVYTSKSLEDSLEIIGPISLNLYVSSSCPYTDFFGRLCDVYPDGRSINVCDGLIRVVPGKGLLQGDGTLRITVDLWATAHQFRPGHRLRLQVSSGAHPRWSRNPGTGRSDAEAVELVVAEQTVYHDEVHPSALILPVPLDA